MSAPKAVPKYRISLSLAQLQWIAAQARQAPASPLTTELYKAVVIQVTKIEADAVKPAFVATVSATPVAVQESDTDRYMRLSLIPQEQRTAEQQKEIDDYRYFNNLMSPKEEAAYDAASAENQAAD